MPEHFSGKINIFCSQTTKKQYFSRKSAKAQGSPLVGGPLALRPYRSREGAVWGSSGFFLEPYVRLGAIFEEKLEPSMPQGCLC